MIAIVNKRIIAVTVQLSLYTRKPFICSEVIIPKQFHQKSFFLHKAKPGYTTQNYDVSVDLKHAFLESGNLAAVFFQFLAHNV